MNSYHNARSIVHMLMVDAIFIVGLFSVCFYFYSRFATALTEDQRKEIDKLRSELSVAFEEFDEKALAEKGVIVQPGWTQDAEDSKTKVSNSKVEVSASGRDEIKALRDEISRAVAQDEYVGSVAGNANTHTKQVKALEQKFALNTRGKHLLQGLTAATADTAAQGSQPSADIVGAGQEQLDDDAPNVVQASDAIEPDIDVRKLQRLELSKRRTKELLVLKSIEEDFSFKLGEDVQEWEHIVHAGQEYFIGRRQVDLLVVQKQTATYQPAEVLHVGQAISYLETYSHWDPQQQQQEGVILVAAADKVLWYRAQNETAQIGLYWQWTVGYSVSGLTHFRVDSRDYLVVSSNQSSRAGYYALNIYQFELHAKEFWIAQRLQMRHACGEVTILDTGRDIILAVAQNNSAYIYTFNPNAAGSDHLRFQLSRSYESEGVELIAGFEMGGRSYLALSGLQPQILLYQQGDFVPKTILGNNFGLVELFFPIPARTYRDDLILLVQHRVDFGTHGLTVLETLIWDGEAFEASIPVPCQLGAHTKYGVSCMLDMQRDEGLKGAALLRRGTEISLIVPRHKAESGLFRLHTELLAKNSELLDLQEIFVFMQDWVREQDELLAQAQAFLGMSDAQISQAQPDFSALETLQTPELYFTGDVGEIHVNDYKWTDEDTNTDLDFVMHSIEQLEHDLHSSRRKRQIPMDEVSFDTLDFDSVTVEELLLERVNNQPFYIQNGALDFEGILNLHSLEVLDESNARALRETSQETLEIEGDLEFEQINGLPWAELKQQLVFRNVPLELANLKVEGEVIVEDSLSLETLNSLSFPDDYLWSSGTDGSIVRAEKVFTDTLTADAVDTDGVINGVNPLDAITLSDAQDWTGLPTFAHLEVAELLELNGTAHGRGVVDLPSNPTLEESYVVMAACNFANLNVLGALHIYGTFDGQQLATKLLDVVQPADDATAEIIIPSKKSFSSVEFPLDFQVLDDAVNGIAVSEFVTLHTEQQLNISVLQGFMYFNSLNVSGTYDGVMIEELLQNSLKIDEPQVSPDTQLNYVGNLVAEQMEVASSLNGVPIAQGYQTLQEDLQLHEAHFEHLQAQTANIPNDVLGSARLNGLNLHSFLAHKTSMPTNMMNIYLDELVLGADLQAERLHGIDANFVLSFLAEIDELPEMILAGKIQVDHVIVTGEVQLHKLNGQQFDEDIQLTAIWLNRTNYLNTRLQFAAPLEVQADLVVEGAYNGQQLPELIEDMIFRSANSTVLLQAPKSFLEDVSVRGCTQLKAINGIPMQAFATKKSSNSFKGTLHVHGNLIVEELQLSGYFNDYAMSSLSSLVRFDSQLQNFVLLGEVPLNRQLQLEDLTVHGNLNDIPQLSAFFGNLVYRDSACMLKGKNNFTGRVTIEKGVYLGSLNGIDVLELQQNMVFINAAAPVIIEGPVTFAATVAARVATVRDALTADNLHSCSLEEWLRESIRVDQAQQIDSPLHFAPGSLDGNSMLVKQLNNMNLSHLITLHTPQNLSASLNFTTLYLDGQLKVEGLINNIDLAHEYQNTLLTHGDQHVSTPLTMQSLLVLEQLQTNAPVNNDKDLQQLATLQGDLEFESPLYFQNVSVHNLRTADLVSGIDLAQWYRDALRQRGRAEQRITGSWSVRNLTVKSATARLTQADMLSDNLVGGQRSPRHDADYAQMCARLAKYMKRAARRAYFLKRLERRFELPLAADSSDIRQAFVLRHAGENYLLSNLGCDSQLQRWNRHEQRYELLHSLQTGLVEQLSVLPQQENAAALKFLTNSPQAQTLNCSFAGLNAWQLNNSQLAHLPDFKPTAGDLELQSGNASSFCALAKAALQELSRLPEGTAAANDTQRLPTHADLLLSNGRELLLLRHANASTTTQRNKRSSPTKISLPLSQSTLKPNATLARKLSFADFRQVVERILSDLVYRLHLQVNVTQLSIPETDLYDEHLPQDFRDIMQELQRQQIYPAHTFADVPLAALQLPANPAQVLAARAVQIVWPVIVEIEEVHGHLRDNGTHEHPICACISNSLGGVVRDVLLLAYGHADASAEDYSATLSGVIQRIREFQHYLQTVIAELHEQTRSQLRAEAAEAAPSEALLESLDVLSTNVSLRSVNCSALHGHFLLLQSGALTQLQAGEMLSLQVGPVHEPRMLLALTTPAAYLAAGSHDGIKVYMPDLAGRLFQAIAAHKPRALLAVRIRDETLLAYVEDCCRVQVLVYRGVQGFVPFSKFDTAGERVQQLLSLSLPNEAASEKALFLAAVLPRKIIFYEFVVAGLKQQPLSAEIAACQE